MKKIILLIANCVFTFLSYSCSQTPKQAKITFDRDTIAFEVKKGKIFTTSFKFRSIGNDTLKIKNVETGCGCMIIGFPKSIAPNSSSEIKIQFDSKEKKDKQILQAIVVESNTKPMLHILYLKATIL